MRYDICVIGAGLLGLATAREVLTRHPSLRLLVIDKEDHIAAHQSSHNSGVLHSGLYYLPGSLKARLCLEGRGLLERLAAERAIPYERCGKVVVALEEAERPRLAELYRRGTANDVTGIRLIGAHELREIEPNTAGIAAIHVPTTGVLDFTRVAAVYAEDIVARGGEVRMNCELRGLRKVAGGGHVLCTTVGEVETATLITCAGLWADRVARWTPGGAASYHDERIIPFRGDYYTLRPQARHLVRALVYPVPDPRFPFLGVHLTRRIDGQTWAGPNAVLATARAGYRRRDVRLRDVADTLSFPGFPRFARKHWRAGVAEIWKDVSKGAFLRDLQRYVPAITAQDLVFGPSGVRAQALRRDGSLVDDFSVDVAADVLHVRNAPSPGATASPAIGRELAARAERAFGWDR
jgi:L-2-hydroxyglutarate oxidase